MQGRREGNPEMDRAEKSCWVDREKPIDEKTWNPGVRKSDLERQRL